MRIRGRVALVTGASSGIGRASAQRLAGVGARLIVHGRDPARLSAVAHDTGGVAVAADLADSAQVDLLARRALDVAGWVDIVVHNAGMGWAGPFAEMAPVDAERLIAVNLTAPIRLTRALLPAMREQGAGCLIFVTSIAGRLGVAEEAVYAASKAGLDIFAESLRGELRGSGVSVGIVVPGAVSTPFFAHRGRPYSRRFPHQLRPEAVADALIRTIGTGSAQRYAPGWLRLAVAVRGTAPGVYRALASRFGGT